MYNTNKMIIISLIGCAFDGNIGNGGDDLKIDLSWFQNARVSQWYVREGRRTSEERMCYDG